MKLSELRRCFEGNHDTYAEYTVLLVDLDLVPSDGVDVVISPLFAREIDVEAGQMRLYSAAARPHDDTPSLALFELFAGAWPLPGVYEVDFDVVVQLPIAPDAEHPQPQELAPLTGVWIGRESEEIWLLVRPQADYPADLLPS
jgi:hypothetical protein